MWKFSGKFFKNSPNLLWAIFLFGFICGFGLSTRSRQLPLGEGGIILKILSFNLGIELGQIGTLSIILVLLFKWSWTKFFLQISSISNHGLIAAGVLFFLRQMHGYPHKVNPDPFGFSQDRHFHTHEDMKIESASPESEYFKSSE